MPDPSGHVVVACDKFKGSLTAAQVIDAIQAGIADAAPGREVRSVLVADGGDGTLAAAEAVGFTHVPVTVCGPTGTPNTSGYAVRGTVAVVEMADACGLAHLPDGALAALTASSRGLGELLAAVLDRPEPSVTEIVLGIGGSASTDGGAGMLAALGARLLDAAGRELPDGGGALTELATLDLSGLHPRLSEVQLTLASDVANPLLGELGAVAIFSPQKGAGSAERTVLEAGLRTFAAQVTALTGRDDTLLPGAGAAGGVGYAAQAVLGAKMRPGIELILELTGFESLCAGAALVVTGEGSLDRQTLLGKTPAGVARAAQAHGIPVVAVCGRALLSPEDVAASGIDAVYALTDLEPDSAVSMAEAWPLLRRLVAGMARERLSG
ncbi:MAG: glycerate kinase [Candidatus Phosphoribacter sp.]